MQRLLRSVSYEDGFELSCALASDLSVKGFEAFRQGGFEILGMSGDQTMPEVYAWRHRRLLNVGVEILLLLSLMMFEFKSGRIDNHVTTRAPRLRTATVAKRRVQQS